MKASLVSAILIRTPAQFNAKAYSGKLMRRSRDGKWLSGVSSPTCRFRRTSTTRNRTMACFSLDAGPIIGTMDEESARERAQELFQQAYQHQAKGELDRAVALYKESIAVFPTAEAYTFLGWTYSFMDQYDEAIAECLHAIEVDPDFGNPYNDIGSYLMQKGQLDEAIPWLEKATRARRYEARAFPYANLGRLYEAKRQYRQALQNYKRALGEQPDYAVALQAVGRLQAMMN